MSDALDELVLKTARARPGSSPVEIARALRVNPRAVLAALARLEAADRAFRASSQRRSYVFAGPTPDQDLRAQLVALANPRLREVARALMRAGQAEARDLATPAGLRPRSTYSHVDELIKAGLVDVARGPRGARILTPTRALARGLERFEPVQPEPDHQNRHIPPEPRSIR